jgi:Ca2+-binding EF-hand superfamily protein
MTTLQRANVTVKPDEILYIYDFIDSDKDGKLDYRELSDVLRGTKTIDATALISAQRQTAGKAHGYTPSELANI